MAMVRRTAQLQLELDDVRKVLPWGGRSPRELTRSFETFRFATEGMGRLDLDASHVGDNKQEELRFELLFPFARGFDG